MTSYIALIRKETDSDFGVEFPDLPGCVTAGRDLDEAMAFAREALALHIDGLRSDGETLPEPSTLESVMRRRANRGAVATLVPAPQMKAKAVRVNITLDADLLHEIDSVAGRGERSAFLAAAARDRLTLEDA